MRVRHGLSFFAKGNHLLKRPITYTFIDDEDKEVTETEVHYFHLFEEELLELESKYKSGLVEHLQALTKSNDNEQIFAFFKKIVLDAYGIRADGGRSFEKSPEIRAKFQNSMAYKQLFKEMTMTEAAAADFINGIFPKPPDQDKPQVVASVDTTKTP